MQNLTPITVRRLRIAAARLRGTRRSNGLHRAIWVAAKNYRRDAAAEPELAVESVEFPKVLADAIRQLTPDLDPTPDVTDDRPIAAPMD